MLQRVLETIKNNNMFNDGDKVVVAVSGGPDSICLLHILYRLREEFNLALYAAHINHCLRGEEADKDEEYVEEFCRELGIQCFSKRIDINKLSKERGLSTESAAREARYEFFEELVQKLGAQKVALAHNANDQAETVLMRIIRGTGMEGIVGIKAVRGNIFVRPLINIKRESIEAYCEEHNLTPRIDKTNLESIYTRNRIRLELIPYIKENFNSDIVMALNRLADTMSRDNEFLEVMAYEKYKKYCYVKGEKVIIDKEAFKEHEAMITRVLRCAVGEIKGNLYNIEKIHIYDLISLQATGTGRKISLPNNIIAFNSYGNIELTLNKCMEKREEKEYLLYVNEEVLIEDYGLKVSLRIIGKDEKIGLRDQTEVKYFDYDRIKGAITIRTRKKGDRFVPFGMKGSKKLKDLFIDLKVPQEERDRIPLVCFGEDIAWIVGYRISDTYKVDKYTNRILEVAVKK